MVGEAAAALLPACGSVRQIAVPPAARRLSTLGAIDYEDAFVFETSSARDLTPQQWSRLILEGAPPALRRALRLGWSALGLQLRPLGSEGAVLGWELRQSTHDFALLGAASSVGMPAELLFKVRPRTILFCTFVQHESRTARAVWAGVEPVHRPVVRSLLEQANRQSRAEG